MSLFFAVIMASPRKMLNRTTGTMVPARAAKGFEGI